MVGIYFSGTGNTKHCVSQFLRLCDGNAPAYAIEDEGAIQAIKENEVIILGYPIYYSNLPKIMREFINNNADCFAGKKIYIIATMGLFSGDGAGCSARILKKYGAIIMGGLHIKMPDCIGDVKILKKTLEKNKEIVKQADKKIKKAVQRFMQGRPTKQGCNFLYHFLGLFGQRLWFYNKTKNYSDKLKIDKNKCVACGKCVSLCPLKNLQIQDKAVAGEKCTMCYRCYSHCPQKAITLLGKTVHEQCLIEKYVDSEAESKPESSF